VRLVRPNAGSVFGTALIGLGLLLLIYAAGLYADLLPGSRVSVPRPPALDRPRPPEAVVEGAAVLVSAPAEAAAPAAAIEDAAVPPTDAAESPPVEADAPEREQTTVAAGPLVPADAEDRAAAPAPPVQTDPAVYAAPLVPADSGDRPYLGNRPRPDRAVRLRMPAIHLETDVVAAGVIANKDGDLEWETVPFVAAHYVETSPVGGRGNAVISGHVVTLREGNVFRNLYQVDFGDTVEVDTPEGTFTYVVRDLALVSPSAVEVMAPTKDSTLTLITCGGEFDPQSRQFSHRLIVTAKLVDWAKRPNSAHE
jgi:LPXTG-site transpeptidase (sortase) family protein